MRFASWNLKRPGSEQARRRVNFLRSRDWDIAVLQEVSPRAWEVIVESGVAESDLYTLRDFDIAPPGNYPHGVALLARNGFRLSAPELIPNLPKAERALAATTTMGGVPVTIAGWHAPNAAATTRGTSGCLLHTRQHEQPRRRSL
jgi:exonuclease III